MSAFDDLLMGALGGIPRLPGALCRAKSELFDEYEDPEVVEYALNQCQSCPARADCERWLDSLSPTARPFGVVAGRVRRPRQATQPEAGGMKVCWRSPQPLAVDLDLISIALQQTMLPMAKPAGQCPEQPHACSRMDQANADARSIHHLTSGFTPNPGAPANSKNQDQAPGHGLILMVSAYGCINLQQPGFLALPPSGYAVSVVCWSLPAMHGEGSTDG
jgi:WhiB family transcriptional regulator, redox-sensing transcriptional regulator